MTDKQYEEFQQVVNSNENIENSNHRRIHRKLERRKRINESKNERKNTCITQ